MAVGQAARGVLAGVQRWARSRRVKIRRTHLGENKEKERMGSWQLW